MATITLGSRPVAMSLLLVAGGDFVCTLTSQDGDWPATATITLEVAGTTWTAALAGPEATFNVDQDDVDTVIEAKPTRFKLWYTDGGTHILWGAGSVVVHRD